MECILGTLPLFQNIGWVITDDVDLVQDYVKYNFQKNFQTYAEPSPAHSKNLVFACLL